MKSIVPTEYEECLTFVAWLELKRLVFSHIPLETYTPHYGVIKRNHRVGVRKGVPDYLIVTPKGLLFIEMKRKVGGKLSKEQVAWMEALNELDGVQAEVAYGADEAIKIVSKFL